MEMIIGLLLGFGFAFLGAAGIMKVQSVRHRKKAEPTPPQIPSTRPDLYRKPRPKKEASDNEIRDILSDFQHDIDSDT